MGARLAPRAETRRHSGQLPRLVRAPSLHSLNTCSNCQRDTRPVRFCFLLPSRAAVTQIGFAEATASIECLERL